MILDKVIHGLFRVLNISIFLGIVGWLFYRKMYKKIKRKMHERESFESNLKENQKLIIQQQELVRNEASLQEERIEKLLELVHHWQVTVEQEKKIRKEQIDTNLKYMQRRYEKQQRLYQEKKMIQADLPEIFSRVQRILEKKYQDKSNVSQVLNTIIQDIK